MADRNFADLIERRGGELCRTVLVAIVSSSSIASIADANPSNLGADTSNEEALRVLKCRLTTVVIRILTADRTRRIAGEPGHPPRQASDRRGPRARSARVAGILLELDEATPASGFAHTVVARLTHDGLVARSAHSGTRHARPS